MRLGAVLTYLGHFYLDVRQLRAIKQPHPPAILKDHLDEDEFVRTRQARLIYASCGHSLSGRAAGQHFMTRPAAPACRGCGHCMPRSSA